MGRYVVTGCAGFVGSAIAARLLGDGHSVVGLDSLTDYYSIAQKKDNLQFARSQSSSNGAEFIVHDVDLVDADLQSLLEGAIAVFHQAGQPGVRASWGTHFDTYTHNNVNATQRLLEAAVSCARPPIVVYASSSSVYGDAESYPTSEKDLPAPRSPYGVTKLAAEHLCGLYAANYGLRTVSLRYFTVYGPRQRPDMAFTRFTRLAATGGEIELYGSGEQMRDFTYIDDVVSANILAAEANTSPGSVYNIAGGSNISVKDCLTLISEISGNDLKVKFLPAVRGDVWRTSGSVEAAQRDLRWAPAVDIKDGLRRHYEWSARLVAS